MTIDSWERYCERTGEALLLAVWIGATWIFGAWSQWWFWPFTGLVFAAGGCLALRFIACARLGSQRLAFSRLAGTVLLACTPFLLYALVRAVQAAVPMDAERSTLLHATAVLVGACTMLGVPPERHQRLATLFMASLTLIGLYGIVNHLAFHSAYVLWTPGFAQYQSDYFRATGTYYCPDHFAGLMELDMALALGVLLSRSASRRARGASLAVIAVALVAILASKSRGAGAIAAVMIGTALWMAPSHLPAGRRWAWRLAALAALAGGIALVAAFGGSYVQRFRGYPWRQLEQSERVQMSAAALRGWREARVFGVGPGMHQNLWPHLAASADGDRATGRWPTYLNNNYHSFEAHDDWAQLLEEYGLAGLGLFLLAMGTVVGALLAVRRHHMRRWSEGAPEAEPGADRMVLGALFALMAMALHSIGDFNLQIPGTVWLLAGITGLGLAAAARDPHRRRRRHRDADAA